VCLEWPLLSSSRYYYTNKLIFTSYYIGKEKDFEKLTGMLKESLDSVSIIVGLERGMISTRLKNGK